MDSKDLLRRFKTAGWVSATDVQSFVAEAARLERDDVERLLGLLVSKGLPGDARDQRNRCLIFGRLAEAVTDKALFLSYVRAMKTGDAQVAAAVAPLLAKVNDISGHGELAALLRSPEPGLRRLVTAALKQIGGTTVFQALMSLCSGKEFAGRAEGLEVAVGIGRHHAIPALAATLAVGTPAEKALALQYLGNAELMAKDVPAALTALAAAVLDPNERIAVQAITSFSTLASEDEYFRHIEPFLDAANLNLARAAIDGLKRFASPRAVEALARKLREGPNPLRLVVLATLEAIGTDDVIPPVVQALNFKKIDVRARAGEVLTTLALAGKVDIARTLLWLLRSKDVHVRRMAVDIAKKIGDPTGELAPKLLRYLRDEDWWVRERVMDALVEMSGRQLTRHLVAYLQDPSDVVRRYAIDALERVKDPGALGALVRAAQGDNDWWVRERAVQVIGALGDPRAVPYLLDLLSKEPDLQRSCVDALGALKARSAAPVVAALLDAADSEMRLAILECLEALEDPAQAGAVQVLQGDGDHRVRNAAKALLSRWNAALQVNASQVAKAYSLLERLLIALSQQDGDDLILAGGHKPYIKKLGKVSPLAAHVFSSEQVRNLLLPCLTAKQVQDLAALRDVDFSFEIKAEGLRFRANVFTQMPGMSAVFRIIKDNIPVLEKLGLPPIVSQFAEQKNGLVLIGGPTGSGKSTTLAGIIDHINRNSSRHVVTLEDPIEVVHKQKKCLINQREIGTHTRSFENALRATLRQDPDVILVGEMRDLPTISFALTAAETGHLVLGTLHTVSVDTSVDRLINAFPAAGQPQVRALLSDTLRAVMCQYLIKRKDGAGRVIAVEVMLNNDAIANLIRKEKTFQLPSVIATSREAGMQSMDSDLERLYRAGMISGEDAYMRAANKKNFEVILGLNAGGEAKAPVAEAVRHPPIAAVR